MPLKIIEAETGIWNVVDDDGSILATESSNAAAWRTAERLEVRKPGRISGLYRSDVAMEVKGRKS
jgi:hypothetical protein